MSQGSQGRSRRGDAGTETSSDRSGEEASIAPGPWYSASTSGALAAMGMVATARVFAFVFFSRQLERIPELRDGVWGGEGLLLWIPAITLSALGWRVQLAESAKRCMGGAELSLEDEAVSRREQRQRIGALVIGTGLLALLGAVSVPGGLSSNGGSLLTAAGISTAILGSYLRNCALYP